jgi:hypothetical protein
MIRKSCPRCVQLTTRRRPSASRPRVTKRRSRGCGSSLVRAQGSSSTAVASAKSTRCFLRLPLAFSGSHWNVTHLVYAHLYTALAENSPRFLLSAPRRRPKWWGASRLPTIWGPDPSSDQSIGFRRISKLRQGDGASRLPHEGSREGACLRRSCQRTGTRQKLQRPRSGQGYKG